MARLATAWEAAVKRIEHKQAEEAEIRANESPVPRLIQKSVYLEMCRAFAAAHHELKDSQTPAKPYMEMRFEQIEDGELIAESLKEVISREESAGADADARQPTFSWKADGTLKVKTGK